MVAMLDRFVGFVDMVAIFDCFRLDCGVANSGIAINEIYLLMCMPCIPGHSELLSLAVLLVSMSSLRASPVLERWHNHLGGDLLWVGF